MANLLTKLFPKTVDLIWADGFAHGQQWENNTRERLAAAIRDLDEAEWQFPKGTRREEAASLMVEQAAQLTESFK